jgi:hypothetical protein
MDGGGGIMIRPKRTMAPLCDSRSEGHPSSLAIFESSSCGEPLIISANVTQLP